MTDEKISAPTPAPWAIQDNAAFGVHVYGPGGVTGGIHIARVSNSAGMKRGEQEANARLIAAAPDMLAALEEARDALFSGAPVTQGLENQICAAIAKAEGRS